MATGTCRLRPTGTGSCHRLGHCPGRQPTVSADRKPSQERPVGIEFVLIKLIMSDIAVGMDQSCQQRDLNCSTGATAIRRIAFVTLGQSPRTDLVPEILATLDAPVEATEYGLLDDLAPAELDRAAPRPDEPAFLSRLRNGRPVELSVEWTHDRFRAVYQRINSRACDLVVLMSASCGQDFRPDGATLQSDKVVERVIDVLLNTDLRLGIIVPLDGLLHDLEPLGGPWAKARVRAARPGDPVALARAASELSDRDIVILHSLGYRDADRDAIHRLLQKPVILNRRLVANAIRDALDQLQRQDCGIGSPPLASRLRSLSNRERQTMYLVAEGLSNKGIARRINISHRTVEIHRARMMEKMAFSSITDLVRVVDMVTDF